MKAFSPLRLHQMSCIRVVYLLSSQRNSLSTVQYLTHQLSLFKNYSKYLFLTKAKYWMATHARRVFHVFHYVDCTISTALRKVLTSGPLYCSLCFSFFSFFVAFPVVCYDWNSYEIKIEEIIFIILGWLIIMVGIYMFKSFQGRSLLPRSIVFHFYLLGFIIMKWLV